MIASLKGIVTHTFERNLILEVENVGYLVRVTAAILKKTLPDAPLTLFISTQVREDSITLYGFSTLKERMLFEKLMSVNGVGPKMAMDLLEVSLDKLAAAILQEDIAGLMRIPGIGKKTAERLVLELKGKIEPPERLGHGAHGIGKNDIPQDAMDALTNLGYPKSHVLRVLDDLPKDLRDAEAIIKYFLQNV